MTVDRLHGFGRQSIKPLLFAADAERSQAAMLANRKAFGDQLKRLWHHFLTPEYIHAGELEETVRRPRQGSVIRPFSAGKQPSTNTSAPGPADLSGRTKFGVREWVLSNIRPSHSREVDLNIQDRIRASVSDSTWAKYDVAWNCLMEFFATRNSQCTLSLPHPLILEFLAWADLTKSLAPSTLRNYLSRLSRIQILLGFEGIKLKSEPLADSFLRGAEARPRPSRRPRAVRRAVSLHLLQILCHLVPELQLDNHEKLLMRAICTVSFFGALRIGELIADPSKTVSGTEKTLLWSDLRKFEEATLLHLKSAKVIHKGGISFTFFPLQTK